MTNPTFTTSSFCKAQPLSFRTVLAFWAVCQVGKLANQKPKDFSQ